MNKRQFSVISYIVVRNGSLPNIDKILGETLIPLVGPDEVIDKSKVHKINKKEKILIKENAEKNKKCHFIMEK